MTVRTAAARHEAPSQGENPYPGPDPLTDPRLFFGRDQETGQVADLLLTNRTVMLHGRSGTGKSSLLRAGVIPQLAQDEDWLACLPTMRPGASCRDPGNRYVGRAMADLLGSEAASPLVTDRTGASGLRSLVNAFEEAVRRAEEAADAQHSLLVFDQFEELITADATDHDAKKAFLLAVGEVLEDPRRWAIFSMRTEFTGELDPYLYLMPRRLSVRIRLEPLPYREAREAMVLPARRAGGAFGDEAADILIKELRLTRQQQADGGFARVPGPHVEPLHLQIVCRQLWTKTGGDITVAALPDPADPEGGQAVDRALRDFYDDEVRRMADGADERQIRDWFEFTLIDGERRPQVEDGPNGTPPASDDPLMRKLLATRLVRLIPEPNRRLYELSHDRLIEPVQEANGAWRAAHRSDLAASADVWDNHGRADHLLLTPWELQATEVAIEGRRLEKIEEEFLEASRAAITAAKNRRTKTALLVLAFLAAVVPLGLWLFYTLQIRAAEQRLDEANAELSITQRTLDAQVLANERQLDQLQAAEAAAAAQAAARAEAAEAARAAELRADARAGLTEATRAALVTNDTQRALLLALDAFAKNADEARPLLHEIVNGTRLRASLGDGPATAVALSPDGRTGATGYRRGEIRRWDLSGPAPAGGALIRTAGSPIIALAADDTGNIVAVHESGEIDVVSSSYAQTMGRVSGDGPAELAAIARELNVVAIARGGTVTAWDLASRAEVLEVDVGGDRIGLAFDPAAERLVISTPDGSVTAYHLPEGKPAPGMTPLPNVGVAAASPGDRAPRLGLAVEDLAAGGKIYSAANDGRVWVHSARGVLLGSLDVGTAQITTIRIVPGSGSIFAIAADGTVHELAHATKVGDISGVATYQVGAGTLVDASLDDLARFVLAATDEYPAVAPGIWETRVRGHTGAIRDVAYHPDGTLVATAGLDGSVQLWTPGGDFVALLRGHTAGVYDVDFDRAGAYLASASSDGTVRVWDVERLSVVRVLTGHTGPVYGVAFRNTQVLASAGDDGRIGLWSIEEDDPLMMRFVSRGAVNAIAFSPGGTLLASGGDDGLVRVWDAANLSRVATLSGHRDSVLSVAFGPDGRLASGGSDEVALVWESDGAGEWPEGGRKIGDHFSGVFEVAWVGPNELAVATSDQRPGVTVWGVDAGNDTGLIEIPQLGRAYGIAVRPDGQAIAAGGGSGDVRSVPRMSPLTDEELQAAAEQRVARELTAPERRRYAVDLPTG